MVVETAKRIPQNRFAEIQRLASSDKVRSASDEIKAEKKRMSEERVRKWPDTLEAQRKKKEAAFFERAAKMEEMRREVDRVEDERRAEERRQQIDYAAKTIYRQTEKAKQIASAELLIDCMHSRKQNENLNNRIKAVEKIWEQQFHGQVLDREAAMLAREQEDQKNRREIANRVAKVQQDQLDEIRQRREQEREEERQAGLELVRQAEEDLQKEKEKNRNKAAMAKRAQQEFKEANAKLAQHREVVRAEQAAEDAKIAAYAARKADLKERQKRQMEKIEGMKQQRRNQIVDEAVKRLAAMNAESNSRQERELAQATQLADERLRRQAEARAAFEQTIHESRQGMIAAKQQKKAMDKQLDDEYAVRWRAYNEEAKEMERLEKLSELREAREHQRALQYQAEDKRQREIDERRETMYQAQRVTSYQDAELEEFNRFAQQRLEAARAAGKDTYPLERIIRNANPSRRR